MIRHNEFNNEFNENQFEIDQKDFPNIGTEIPTEKHVIKKPVIKKSYKHNQNYRQQPLRNLFGQESFSVVQEQDRIDRQEKYDRRNNGGKPNYNDRRNNGGKPNYNDRRSNDGKPNDRRSNDGKPNDMRNNDGKPNDRRSNDGKPNGNVWGGNNGKPNDDDGWTLVKN